MTEAAAVPVRPRIFLSSRRGSLNRTSDVNVNASASRGRIIRVSNHLKDEWDEHHIYWAMYATFTGSLRTTPPQCRSAVLQMSRFLLALFQRNLDATYVESKPKQSALSALSNSCASNQRKLACSPTPMLPAIVLAQITKCSQPTEQSLMSTHPTNVTAS